jgi:hypothetical protein
LNNPFAKGFHSTAIPIMFVQSFHSHKQNNLFYVDMHSGLPPRGFWD